MQPASRQPDRPRTARGRGARAAAGLVSLALAAACSHLPGFERESPLQAYQEKMLEKRDALSQVDEDQGEPETLASRVESGDVFAEKGELDRAMLKYLEAVRMNREATLPRERIGYLQLTRDLERAEAIFEQILLEDPSNASAERGVGLARLGMGDLSGAREALERALVLEPDSASAQYALGAVLDLQGDHAGALEHVERARLLRPEDATIANGVGVAHLMLGDLPRAEDAFRDAIRLDARVATYHNNLGLALGRQGRYDAALAAFRRVGDEQAALNNLGYVYYLNGDYDAAVAQYEHALLEPGDQKLRILRNLNAALDARDAEASVPASRP